MRVACKLVFLLFLSGQLVGGATTSRSCNEDEPKDSPQSAVNELALEETLQRVRDLESDEFAVREESQRWLKQRLSETLPQLIEIAESSDERASQSLLQFLGFVGQDVMSAEGKIAYECLVRISKERTTQRGILSQKILEGISVQMRAQAIERLQSLGVNVTFRQLTVLTRLEGVRNALVIDEKFQGTVADLKLLQWLYDVKFVKIEGPNITGEVLEQVMRLPMLRSLQIVDTPLKSADLKPLLVAADMELLEILYTPIDDDCIPILENVPIYGDLQLFGTDVSSKGAKELVDKIETANVFVGRGGFLGITCEPSNLTIQEVIPGGPAALAGIKMRDKLRKIDGVPIYNFEDLRRQLAKSAAGEKVLVEYDRPVLGFRRPDKNPEPVPGRAPGTPGIEYETIEVEIELGRRPSDVGR